MNLTFPSLAPFLLYVACSSHALAQSHWTGSWQTHFSGGGGRIGLEQKGDRVTGTYPLYSIELAGEVEGRVLRGTWRESESPTPDQGEFSITMSADGRLFDGGLGTRGWWTGERVEHDEPLVSINVLSPRAAFIGFLVACNRAQAGVDDAWGIAAEAVELGSDQSAPSTSSQRLRRVAELFELIDLTTVHPTEIPDRVAADSCLVRLSQAGSDAVLELTLHRNAQGEWRIVEPTRQQHDDAKRSLLARTGGKAPAGEDFHRLHSPRATMRSFLEGMTHWKDDDGARARAAMDLSVYTEIIRVADGELSAMNLRHALNNIGMSGLQSIPDDGTDHTPYVHFVHGDSRIEIVPSGREANAPWKFSAETVLHLARIYRASAELPPPEFVPPGTIDDSTYITLRAMVAANSPYLLRTVANVEAWQFVALLSALGLSIVLARFVASLLGRILSRLEGKSMTAPPQPRWFALSLILLLVAAIMHRIPHLIGIPASNRQYIIPVLASVLCIAAMLVAWRVLTVVGDVLGVRFARTSKQSDDIWLTFSIAVVRLCLVFATALGIASVWSISATNILAGLGIGGLAFAFASRETLSNVFGAGILVTDRPFRSGDWIVADGVEGSVEEVGVRSTRIRTLGDSIVVVPNGKLADSTINNLGTRRHRLLDLKLFVTKGGTPARLEAFIAAIRARLESDRAFASKDAMIGVVALSARAIEIQVTTHVDIDCDNAECEMRHRLLTDFMSLAESAGLGLGKGMERSALERNSR